MTENALCIDGRLTTLAETLAFEYSITDYRRPWRIHSLQSDRVDLVFRPRVEKRLRVELLLAGAEAHICFGHFEGTIRPDGAAPIQISRLLGWAEEFRGRW